MPPFAALLLALGVLFAAVSPSSADAIVTARVSVSSTGAQSNGLSFLPSISADGRFVSFTSAASSLVPDDTNGNSDVFVHDRQTGTTTRVSVSSSGGQGNGGCGKSSISADGRFIAFASTATNLVDDDTNGANDVFLHDRQTGTTTRVSVSSAGVQGNGTSHTPAISADGRYIAFESAATNLVPGDTNNLWDVFVHDRLTGQTTRVSVSSTGGQSNGDSRWASISADGRYISFTSGAGNLVPGFPGGSGPIPPPTQVYVHDAQTGETTGVSVSSNGDAGNDNSLHNAISAKGRSVVFSSFAGNLHPDDNTSSEDLFVHDRQTGATTLESVSSSGQQANAWSFRPAISADGRFITFVSDATNLVPDDTNGARDVFVRDRQAGTTVRASVATDGTQGNANSGFFTAPAISHDGLHIAFESHASNLVPDDTNNVPDVFVRGPSWPQTTPGDLNGDGSVGVADLLILLANWGACADCGDCPADLDGNCNVGVADLLILLANWG